VCGNNLIFSENVICKNCSASLHFISEPNLINDFNRQYRLSGYLDGLLSLYYFEKDKAVHKIIHSIKYGSRFNTGIYFGELYGKKFREKIMAESIDYIVPIPLHHLKKAERGYNQSDYIVKGISKAAGIKTDKRIIKRIRYTRSQTKLTIEERRRNMKGAFFIKNKKRVEGKCVLIFDDVITTGVTITECAKVFKKAGAKKVFAGSIALVP
jgi:Predicted amidophosphoribosyltransferases